MTKDVYLIEKTCNPLCNPPWVTPPGVKGRYMEEIIRKRRIEGMEEWIKEERIGR